MKDLLAVLLLAGMMLCLFIISFGAMADQKLADPYGKTIGYIRELPDGRQVIKDPYGKTYGSFSPKAGPHGQTYDQYGRMIGTGNQLMILLPPKEK